MFKFRNNPLDEMFGGGGEARSNTSLMRRIADSTKAKVAIAGSCAALVLVAGVAATVAMTPQTDAGAGAAETTAIDMTPQTMTIDVTADAGWTDSSTPAIVHVTGQAATGDADTDSTVDFYHAIKASADNTGSDGIELSPGVYTIETISPLNSDGSAYTVWKTGDAQHVIVGDVPESDAEQATASAAVVNPFVTVAYAAEGSSHYHCYYVCNKNDFTCELKDLDAMVDHCFDSEHYSYHTYTVPCKKTDCTDDKYTYVNGKLKIEMTQVPADQVTDEMVKDIVDKTTEAVKGGDSSLKGDAGADVLEKLDANVKNNANASEETKDSAETAKETTDTSGEGSKTTADASSVKGDSGSSSATSKGDSNPSSASTGTSGGQTSAHTHNWVAQTSTVHHDAVTHVVHHDAVTHTEDVIETKRDCHSFVCNDCLHDFGNDGDAYEDHAVDTGHYAYHSVTFYTNVVVGQKTVVDQAAWDETVVDSAAWNETVTNGYRCSTCGATK